MQTTLVISMVSDRLSSFLWIGCGKIVCGRTQRESVKEATTLREVSKIKSEEQTRSTSCFEKYCNISGATCMNESLANVIFKGHKLRLS